jgi:hypothetical protein
MAFAEALLLFVGMTTGAQLHAAPLVGRAIAPDGMALPGVEIAIAGEGTDSTVITDDQGRFQFADLPPATYSITATMVGFLTQRLAIHHPTAKPLLVRLPYAPLAEVLWVQVPPAEAYRQAVAIAHLRIVGTAEPTSCEGAGMIGSLHRAAVLRVFKGTLPDVISLGQETAGRCWDGSAWQEGVEGPYRVGQEYVIFLAGAQKAFTRVAGPLLAFRVFDGDVALNGFGGGNHRLNLDELAALLERLGQ